MYIYTYIFLANTDVGITCMHEKFIFVLSRAYFFMAGAKKNSNHRTKNMLLCTNQLQEYGWDFGLYPGPAKPLWKLFFFFFEDIKNIN